MEISNNFGKNIMKEIHSYITAITILLLLSVLLWHNNLSAQSIEILTENSVNKSPGQYTKTDWAALIDSRWSGGLSNANKLILFDNLWTDLTSSFGAFQNLDVNVDSLYDLYRIEVAGGVSRGRFAAITNHFMRAFNDGHTRLFDLGVNFSTLQAGTPLLVIGAIGRNTHFGAVVTPQADSSILVYKVSNSHPIGLARGDIILGYDGVSWMDLQKQLMNAQLPLRNYTFYGSTRKATHQLIQMAAGLNWHLFDTIDVLKYTTGETLHFPTSSLSGQNVTVYAQEGMDIPGVEWPNPDNGDYISWGIVEGTKIGYIYSTSWFDDPARNILNLFRDAVDSLMQSYDTDGIIFDYRRNTGGTTLAQAGYELLFNTDVQTIGYDVRGNDPDSRFRMIPSTFATVSAISILGDKNTFYDKPIAILFGPSSISAGDLESLRLKFHPMSRSFGRPSNGAFTLSDEPTLGFSGWSYKKATGIAFMAADHSYLAHTAVSVDEEIWLEVDDVAKGEDTVVKRAMEWMNNLVYSHSAIVSNSSAFAGIEIINLVTEVHNPNSHSLFVQTSLESDSVTIDSIKLFDDGLHNDGSAGDGLWGADFLAPLKESYFKVNIESVDISSNISRVLPIATRFTTVGPISYKSHTLLENMIPNPGDLVQFSLSLENKGVSTTAKNLHVELSSSDACVTSIQASSVPEFNEIAPGETKSSKNGSYKVSISEDCSVDKLINIDISISFEGYQYWTDSLKIQLISVDVVENESVLPFKNNLSNAYPNPFNPITTIEYELAEAGEVQLLIFNLLGQEVARLIDETKSAGKYKVIWDATRYSSGIYYYRIETEHFNKTQKLILLK